MINWGDDNTKKKKTGDSRRWGVETAATPEKENNSVKIDGLLKRIEPLLEQVNNLYNLFATGVERLPPREKRKQLETWIANLQATPKANPTYAFKVTTLVNRFATFRDRWDRLVRDLESGKIKRIVGPKKK